jgi:hypothetical protein
MHSRTSALSTLASLLPEANSPEQPPQHELVIHSFLCDEVLIRAEDLPTNRAIAGLLSQEDNFAGFLGAAHCLRACPEVGARLHWDVASVYRGKNWKAVTTECSRSTSKRSLACRVLSGMVCAGTQVQARLLRRSLAAI